MAAEAEDDQLPDVSEAAEAINGQPPLANEAAEAEDGQLPLVADTNSLPDTLSASAAHPEAAEIIRQVEYYFSEENLPYDKHLLGLFKEGDGSVSFNEICAFARMRKFKPKTAVREALRQSSLVHVSEDGKRLSRKIPLATQIAVTPQVVRDRKKIVVPEDKPWLTKGMLRPTGFEEYATDGPIKPQEHEEDRRDYDPDVTFTCRIETAITRFCARRKMHWHIHQIFERFMLFGGFVGGQRQFIGGLATDAMEDLTKKQIADLVSYYAVSDEVVEGLCDNGANVVPTWVVDFEGVAKAFLSSHWIDCFAWDGGRQVENVTNVLRNFYNFLLLHDVCPEYKAQIMAAIQVCDVAQEELPKLREFASNLPGDFSIACSTLFGGNWDGLHANAGDWDGADDSFGLSKSDSELIFKAGIFAHGTEGQLFKFEEATKDGTVFKVISSEEDVGLEITSLEPAGKEALSVYTSETLQDTVIRPMGKVRCKRWKSHRARPGSVQASRDQNQEFEFLVDEDMLQYCVPGMKLECEVKTLDLGFQWIDRVEATYATFFTWLANGDGRKNKRTEKAVERSERVAEQTNGGQSEAKVELEADDGAEDGVGDEMD